LFAVKALNLEQYNISGDIWPYSAESWLTVQSLGYDNRKRKEDRCMWKSMAPTTAAN